MLKKIKTQDEFFDALSTSSLIHADFTLEEIKFSSAIYLPHAPELKVVSKMYLSIGLTLSMNNISKFHLKNVVEQ